MIKKKVMNRKTQVIIACVCCVAVIIASLGGYLIYQTTSGEKALKEEAINIVDAFLNAYKNEEDDMTKYLSAASLNSATFKNSRYQSFCAHRINHKIVDATVNDGIVIVTVEIENIDLNGLLNQLNEKNFDSDEETIEYFYSLFQASDAPMMTYKCEVTCKEYPTGMKILCDGELSNALLGGYSAYVTGNVE